MQRMPDMVVKQPVAKLSTDPAAAPKAAEPSLKKTASKQVTFNDESSAIGVSVGDLYGQPQTSPVKQDICREKTCMQKKGNLYC